MIVLFQIYRRLWKWKNFENRPVIKCLEYCVDSFFPDTITHNSLSLRWLTSENIGLMHPSNSNYRILSWLISSCRQSTNFLLLMYLPYDMSTLWPWTSHVTFSTVEVLISLTNIAKAFHNSVAIRSTVMSFVRAVWCLATHFTTLPRKKW